MSLPLSAPATTKCSKWLKQNFGDEINKAIINTPYSLELIIAIALKETAQKWQLWIDKYSPEVIIQRCVFDASGDFPGTQRSAFPRNKNELIQRYGKSITDVLIDEANKTRAMPQPGFADGYNSANYLYKGYGIFQYDLQNIVFDAEFFTQKKWYNFSDCLQKLIEILNAKSKQHDDLKDVVKAYNGAGKKAEEYSNNVFEFMSLV